ncbi:MAG: LL-diaminopimelate aminotransferase [Firmicutes bacterium]|nr:LL-diaminopimelate aminotransferase [Bacillota bacterium]
MLNFEQADRVKNLPPYLFARIEKLIAEKREEGIDVISLGIGDPDMPTPEHIVEELKEQAEKTENHQYPSSVGMLSYRQAVADFYKKRFGVELDPKSEVVTLIGSKEGIGHISWCYLNPGDVVLVPDPGYPVYSGGAILAGAKPYAVTLKEENGFKPNYADIPTDVAKKAKMMFINYPNNPTGAVADMKLFEETVAFAKENNILVCHDNAYSEIAFDGYRPPSFLEAKGAKEVGIEFGSVSKPYNMTGWRIGWAAGHPEVVDALGRLKSNVDSGQFQAIQYAAIKGLTGPQDALKKNVDTYDERRQVVVDGLKSLGWNIESPKATFYVWVQVPKGFTSASFAEYVIDKTGVVITPGSGYGESGEGYFRISLTIPKERLQEAFDRMKNSLGKLEF